MIFARMKNNNMSENKQIEELAATIHIHLRSDAMSRALASFLYEEGWRKQSEGKWKFHKDGSGTCSECHITQKNIWDYDNWQNFCGHCGAKMTRGE